MGRLSSRQQEGRPCRLQQSSPPFAGSETPNGAPPAPGLGRMGASDGRTDGRSSGRGRRADKEPMTAISSKVLHVVGARPNFVKMAPLIRALAGRSGVTTVLAHTGQHYDRRMSEEVI